MSSKKSKKKINRGDIIKNMFGGNIIKNLFGGKMIFGGFDMNTVGIFVIAIIALLFIGLILNCIIFYYVYTMPEVNQKQFTENCDIRKELLIGLISDNAMALQVWTLAKTGTLSHFQSAVIRYITNLNFISISSLPEWKGLEELNYNDEQKKAVINHTMKLFYEVLVPDKFASIPKLNSAWTMTPDDAQKDIIIKIIKELLNYNNPNPII